MSDMRATKASFLDEHAARTGRAFLRFDYSGHGESEGRFEDGTIGAWLEESLAVDPAGEQGRANPRRLLDGRLARSALRRGSGQKRRGGDGSPAWSSSRRPPT